jgi:hypothetical protein
MQAMEAGFTPYADGAPEAGMQEGSWFKVARLDAERRL